MSSSLRFQLDESLLHAEIYNTLPNIKLDDIQNQKKKQFSAPDSLLNVISDHDMNGEFSIHLLHQHYNFSSNHVMVYEQFLCSNSAGFPPARSVVPKTIDQLFTLGIPRGKFFYYRSAVLTMSTSEFIPKVHTHQNARGWRKG